MHVYLRVGILLSVALAAFGFPEMKKWDFKHLKNPKGFQRIRDMRHMQVRLPDLVHQKLQAHRAKAPNKAVTDMPVAQKTEAVQTEPISDLTNETTILGDSDYDYNNTDWETDVDRRGPHHGFPLPKFLKNVSAKARREFFRIVHNKNISRKKMVEELDKWAKRQGPKIEKALHKYERDLIKYLEVLHKKTTKIVNALPKTYDKVNRILSDPNLSTKQVIEKLRALKISRPVARSLRAVMFIAAHSGGRPLEEEPEDENIDNIGVGLGYGPFGMNYGNGENDETEY